LEGEFEKLLNGSVDLDSGKHHKHTNGHQGPSSDVLPGAGAPGQPGAFDDMDAAGAPGKPGKPGSSDDSGAGAPGLPGDGEITVQNVGAKANKATGNAVSQAISKRAAPKTKVQNVTADANNAVSNAEIHKAGVTNVQTVGSSGNQTGIANALINSKNGTELNLQDVTATGGSAAATATINEAGKKNIQNAVAIGEESAIASSSIGGGKSDVDPAHSTPKRAACLPLKMDDNVREYIAQTVAHAMKQLKKELAA